MDIKTEALNYIKDRYIEEQSRFKHFEEKCGKLVTLMTIVIGIFTALVGFKSKVIFSPVSEIEWLILVACGAISLVLACSWGHALLALKLGECPVAPKSRANADYILGTSDEKSLAHMIDCYVDTTEKLSVVIDRKAQNLEHAYNEMAIAAWISGLLVILIAIKELVI